MKKVLIITAIIIFILLSLSMNASSEEIADLGAIKKAACTSPGSS